MPRKAMKCIVELDAHTVVCPGTYLRDYGYVYLRVSCMGLEVQTKAVPPTFPLFFHERLRFERTFKNCQDPAYISVLLKGEDITIELRQHDDYISDGYVIAHTSSNAKDFLYPTAAHPSHTGREITLFKTSLFNPIRITGESVRLEFNTRTTIKEVPEANDFSSYSPRRSRSPTRQRKRSSSPVKGNVTSESIPAWKYSVDFPKYSSTSRRLHKRSFTEPATTSSTRYRSFSPTRNLRAALDDLDITSGSKSLDDTMLEYQARRESPNLRAALSASDRIQTRVRRVLRSSQDSDLESVDSLDVLRDSLREERKALSDAIQEADRKAYYRSLGIDL